MCPVYLNICSNLCSKSTVLFSAPVVSFEVSSGGVLASKSFLRKENKKFPQAQLSYLDAGKLITMPLRSFETLSPGPTVSHPLTFGKSQASVITLVKISIGIKLSSIPMCKFLRWLLGRHWQSTYGLPLERAAGRGCVSGVPNSPGKSLNMTLQLAHLLNGSNRVVGNLAKHLTLPGAWNMLVDARYVLSKGGL